MANRWEYRVETLKGGLRSPKPEALEHILNAADAQGWELLDLVRQNNSNDLWVVLGKRASRGKATRSKPKQDNWLSDWG